jgi:hypothetical protein
VTYRYEPKPVITDDDYREMVEDFVANGVSVQITRSDGGFATEGYLADALRILSEKLGRKPDEILVHPVVYFTIRMDKVGYDTPLFDVLIRGIFFYYGPEKTIVRVSSRIQEDRIYAK